MPFQGHDVRSGRLSSWSAASPRPRRPAGTRVRLGACACRRQRHRAGFDTASGLPDSTNMHRRLRRERTHLPRGGPMTTGAAGGCAVSLESASRTLPGQARLRSAAATARAGGGPSGGRSWSVAGEVCLAPFGEAEQSFSCVLAAQDARQQRRDTLARRVRAVAEPGAGAGQCGLYA